MKEARVDGGILRRVIAVGAVAALVVGAACSDDDDDSGGGETETVEAPAVEWPMLGRDLGNSRAATDETTVGADNVADLQPAWQRDGISGVTGTPVVDDGVVYLGDWTSHVRALDAETGEELWEFDLESYYVGGSVALDDERVFVGTFDGQVVALDRASGEQLWRTPIGDHPQAALFGSVIHADGLVLAGIASYAELTGGDIASFRGHVAALDAETGEEVWRYWTTAADGVEGPGVPVWSTPGVDLERGHVYITTGNNYAPPTTTRSDAVIALELATGQELWVNQYTSGDAWTLADQQGPDADIGAPPNLFRIGDRDVLGVGDKAGIYRTLDRETGEVIWTAGLTEGGLQGGVLASAASADGGVFVASNKASTTADLIGLDQETGAELWRTDLEGHVSGPVSWANGVVYVADDTGRISGFDAADGSRLWSHEVEERAAGGIAVVDGTVYAGWGWWFTSPPDDPKGGLIAFRVDGSGESGGSDAEDDEDESSAVDGEEIYQENCSVCHGNDGDGASGPSLRGVDDRLTLEEHLEIVREGREEMPPWEDRLTPEEIAAVVEYQRTVLAED